MEKKKSRQEDEFLRGTRKSKRLERQAPKNRDQLEKKKGHRGREKKRGYIRLKGKARRTGQPGSKKRRHRFPLGHEGFGSSQQEKVADTTRLFLVVKMRATQKATTGSSMREGDWEKGRTFKNSKRRIYGPHPGIAPK